MRRLLLDNNPYVVGLVEFKFVSLYNSGLILHIGDMLNTANYNFT